MNWYQKATEHHKKLFGVKIPSKIFDNHRYVDIGLSASSMKDVHKLTHEAKENGLLARTVAFQGRAYNYVIYVRPKDPKDPDAFEYIETALESVKEQMHWL